ncbi:disulfide isomerase [Histoplasma capsulatum var. duboisii H88]|uniref:Disulfide isomerase n=1 Tax=Ajellomyces capsulatus (strain H88) TaxID=544711 RepID=A0A8A1L9Q8_AJEC8|nr:disulfide isomerase [Histoplasma capsulatum var. duboisii H88]
MNSTIPQTPSQRRHPNKRKTPLHPLTPFNVSTISISQLWTALPTRISARASESMRSLCSHSTTRGNR